MRIDAHQHFWHPARGDYGWMPKDDPILSRPYGPADLAPELKRLGIAGTVLVQAAPSVEETEYMLGIADATPFVLGVVGWVDFEDAGSVKVLERLKAHPKFVGVRPMIQDIPDVDWMLRPDVARTCAAIADLDLTFDALGFPRHLPNFRKLLKQHPKMRTVIDHCMKPEIRNHPAGERDWQDGMRALAEESGAFVKISGLVTEGKPGVSVAELAPYVQFVLDCFGTSRAMWGSDWPVSRLRCEYGDWVGMARTLFADLTDEDRARLFGGNAAAFYRLPA